MSRCRDDDKLKVDVEDPKSSKIGRDKSGHIRPLYDHFRQRGFGLIFGAPEEKNTSGAAATAASPRNVYSHCSHSDIGKSASREVPPPEDKLNEEHPGLCDSSDDEDNVTSSIEQRSPGRKCSGPSR